MAIYLILAIAVTYDCPWGLGKAPGPIKELVCSVDRSVSVSLPYVSKEAALKELRPGQELWQVVKEPRKAQGKRNKIEVNWTAGE